MTGEAQPFPFSDVLLRAIAEVRSIAPGAETALTPDAREDLAGVLNAAGALEQDLGLAAGDGGAA